MMAEWWRLRFRRFDGSGFQPHVEYKAKTPDRAISTRNLMLTYDGHRNKQANGDWGSHGANHQLMAIGEKDKLKTQSHKVLVEFKWPFMRHNLESGSDSDSE